MDYAYKNLSTGEKIFKDLIWNPIIKAGEVALAVHVPFLALPVIKQLDEYLIENLTDWVFKQVVLFIDISAIQLVNEVHQHEYEKLSIGLKIIAHDKGVDSNEFKDARERAKLALSKFTRFGAAE